MGGKGKGKGKGKNRSDSRGNEGGRYVWQRDRSRPPWREQEPGSPRPRGRSRERQSPTEYYYIKYPDKAKGLKVIKCVTPSCFGCCLQGDNIPEHCYYCNAPFRVPSGGGGSSKSDPVQPTRPAPRAKVTPTAVADDAQSLYEELIANNMA